MIRIERINVSDLPDLAVLYEQLIGNKPNVDEMKKVFSQMENTFGYQVIGAKCDGELAGSAMGIVCHNMVWECKPFMVIECVIVSKRYRRMGIGKKLLQELERIALEHGCWYIILVSGAAREEAHSMYEGQGYIEDVRGFRKRLK